MTNTPRDYLICYDITCPKRLQKLHRVLQSMALALEYSLFLYNGTREQKDQLMAQLSHIIDPKQDDLRCYPLPRNGWQQRLGKATLPEGIYFSGLPSSHNNRRPTEPKPSPDPIGAKGDILLIGNRVNLAKRPQTIYNSRTKWNK